MSTCNCGRPADAQCAPCVAYTNELRGIDRVRNTVAGYSLDNKDVNMLHDSGKRQVFDSGMMRDTGEGKIDYELCYNGPMFDRWAKQLTLGAIKYPDPPGSANWMKAEGKAELIRFRKSAARHFRQWLRGDTDEDHAAAVYFNVNGYEYVKEKMVGQTTDLSGKSVQSE